MSSRNQRQLLQLSIATLLLFQVFVFFSPAKSRNFLSYLSFAQKPATQMRYELKIISINGSTLKSPLLLSDHWATFGVDEKGSAQLLIDELARALGQNDLDKAQSAYAKLEEEHIVKLDSFYFEVEQINITRVPRKSGGFDRQLLVLNSWSSDQLRPAEPMSQISVSSH